MMYRSFFFTCLTVLFVYLPNVNGQQDEFRKAFPNIKDFAIPLFNIAQKKQRFTQIVGKNASQNG